MLIRCKENTEIVNINNVINVHPVEPTISGDEPYKIYFVYTEAETGRSAETTWRFSDAVAFNRVLAALEVKEV